MQRRDTAPYGLRLSPPPDLSGSDDRRRSMEKPKATKGQRMRIEEMLLSGLIDQTEAQEIIAKPRQQYQSLAMFEGAFPGRGQAIMSILEPFRGYVALQRAQSDLESVAPRAIFWREVRNVQTLPVGVRLSLAEYAYWEKDHLARLLNAEVGPRLDRVLTLKDRQTLEDLLKSIKWISFGNDYWALNWMTLRDSFWRTLFFACGFVIAGKTAEAEKFDPLLELWRQGNFPISLSESGDLMLVLVAD